MCRFSFSEVEESAVDLRGRAAPPARPGRGVPRPMGGDPGRRHGGVASLGAAEGVRGARRRGGPRALQEHKRRRADVQRPAAGAAQVGRVAAPTPPRPIGRYIDPETR